KAIHGGKMPDVHKAVAPPIYQTATFYYDTAEEGARLGQEIPPGYIYTRWANPTTRALEEKVALLESGEDALATSSGMGAVSAAVLTAVKPGDHAVAPSAIYQATYQLFADILPSYGVQTTLIPDSSTAAYERALRPNTKLLFVETPNNPMLGITEIEAVAALAHTRGAAAIADNTWATPYNQTPLTLGADVVVHSVTKYLGGHHDVTAGVIVGRAEFIKRARRQMRGFGGMLSFEIKGGYAPGVRAFEALQVCKRATSLGGISTLVSHPAGISSVQMPKDVREAAGIAEGLIRVSVGIEDAEDLLNDFEQALRQA